eukprot:scaffold33444_cov18-Tisochrysis_lutea.AAC.1
MSAAVTLYFQTGSKLTKCQTGQPIETGAVNCLLQWQCHNPGSLHFTNALHPCKRSGLTRQSTLGISPRNHAPCPELPPQSAAGKQRGSWPHRSPGAAPSSSRSRWTAGSNRCLCL